MILKYLATLAPALALITFAVSWMQFATHSQVRSGSAVDETVQFELTIDEDFEHTYVISSATAQFLEAHVGFRATGAARVVTSAVEVTPKDVSWSEGHRTITATGAAMTTRLRWDTPSDTAAGARALIYLDVPEIPGFEGKTTSFHLTSGREKDGTGRYLIREATTYRNPLLLFLGRFIFALAASLP